MIINVELMIIQEIPCQDSTAKFQSMYNPFLNIYLYNTRIISSPRVTGDLNCRTRITKLELFFIHE